MRSSEVFETFPLDVKGKSVMVKVNALKAGDPETTAYVTDYRLLRAVLDRLETLEPARVIVGDSVGTESYGNSETVFEVTRLKEAAGEHYLNINTDLVLVPFERPFKRTGAVARAILEADVYISVPKMKTHGLTVLSGSVKNNYGLLVGAQKAWYHYYSVRPEIFAEIIVEMYRLRPPDLVIMDAIVAMEGYGPSSPETRTVNKVLASDDGVALDTVQAKIIGLDVDEIPYLRLARELGLGETDLASIEIVGDAETIEDWHLPESTELTYSYRAGIGTRKDEHRLLPGPRLDEADDRPERLRRGMLRLHRRLPDGRADARRRRGHLGRRLRLQPLQRLQGGLRGGGAEPHSARRLDEHPSLRKQVPEVDRYARGQFNVGYESRLDTGELAPAESREGAERTARGRPGRAARLEGRERPLPDRPAGRS